MTKNAIFVHDFAVRTKMDSLSGKNVIQMQKFGIQNSYPSKTILLCRV
jgi:hypothetical protein